LKRILLLTNHSFMLLQFRRELIQAMLRDGMEVIIGVPFGDHIQDFKDLGCEMIDTPLNRRSINPFRDLSLLRQYFRILKTVKPDMYALSTLIFVTVLALLLAVNIGQIKADRRAEKKK